MKSHRRASFGVATLAALTCVTCGDKGGNDAGLDATVDAASEKYDDSSATDAADAADSHPCLPPGAQCTDPSVCCRTVCEFVIGDEGGTGKCQ
jgi:hypothetical protein